MTIDEAIQRENKIAEENQKIVDTEIVFDDVSLSQLYCDDTEVIEEHLSNYRKCAEYHKQLAEWLEELKTIKEMDLSIPQHFTKEQSDWIKAYCIKRNIESYNEAIDDLIAKCENAKFAESDEISLSDVHTGVNSGLSMAIHFAEQLKEGGESE